MKLRRLSSVLLILCLFLTLSPIRTSAFDRKEHDNYMNQVLFKNFKTITAKENGTDAEKALYALNCASYLTIDQYNGKGQTTLDALNSFGVKNIPNQIKDIDYSASPKVHRSSTHRGWSFNYLGTGNDLWKKRKAILQNTADAIFDFKDDTSKRDSFCALIYYIHILGDHLADDSFKLKNGQKMDVGGRTDKDDIITELEENFKILFKTQQNTQKYISLVAALDRYYVKLSELVTSEGGINTDEKFEAKQEYTQNVMDLLTMYIPEMLKSEEFFAEVFYK